MTRSLKKYKIMLSLLLAPVLCVSQVIIVKQDGTGDVTTIQEGVNLSKDGDTVLVWPGTYAENVVCNNKNITLGSLALTSGDSSYMYQTKIEGGFAGSCLKIRDCLTGIVICGFTMEHGSGSFHGPPGGGGISIENVTQITIIDCMVQNNVVTGTGGGIYCEDATVYLSGVTIRNNHAYKMGGGITDLGSSIEFDSINLCNIYLNYAGIGADIYKYSQADTVYLFVDTFTVVNPDYYYLFPQAGWGYPGDDIICEINTGKIEQTMVNLYVAPWGDNSSSGLSPEEPLKNISFALLKMASDSLSPDTIHLAAGVYAPTTGEKFPLSLKAYASIKGASRESTILDGEEETWILNGIVFADHYQISDLTVMNGNGELNNPLHYGAIDLDENNYCTLANILFKNNHGHVKSCGAIWNSNNFTLKNVEFSDNIGGQALRVGHANSAVTFYDTVRLYNCHFKENIPSYFDPEEGFGGGLTVLGESSIPGLICCFVYNSLFEHNFTKVYPFGGGSISLGCGFGSKVNVVNCTFGDNTSENPEGANIGVVYNSDLYVYNSIMYENEPAEFYMYTANGEDCSLSIDHSLVSGGEEEIRILSPWNNLYYGLTNIDADPNWDTASPWPYSLLEGSPCIDAGTTELPADIVLPDTDFAGNPRVWGDNIDMGAYEYGPWVKLPDERYTLYHDHAENGLSVFPNPFYHSTEIIYRNRQNGHLQIELFDLHGLKLATFLDVRSMPCNGSFLWDGTDQDGRKLPSGTYVLQLTLDNRQIDYVKVILAK